MMFYKEINFKKTPIGNIPKDWEVVRLNDVCELIRGTEPGSESYNTEGIGVKFIRVSNISKQVLKEVFVNKTNNLVYCKKEDVLLALDGVPGVVAKGFEGAISSGIRIVKPRTNKIDKEFLFYILQHKIVQKVIENYTTGTTIRHASRAIEFITFPLPPLLEQNSIAQILSTVDKAIQKINEIIAKTECLKKGLMQELLTKGLVLGFMFDTNVFNAILNMSIDLEQFPSDLKYYVTHIQYDEICSMQNEERKRELLKIMEKVPSGVIATEGAVYGISRYDMAKYMSEADAKQYDEMLRRLKELDEKVGKKKPLENQARDVLIALTSIKNCLILVTDDKNLKKVTEEFNGQAITFEQFQKGEYKEFKDSEIGRIPKNWKIVELGEVVEINKELIDPTKEIPNETFIYIDIDSIEGGTGKIRNPKRILGRDAPSRARRVIHENEVIMSTVRPYLKAFAIVPKEYDNQICSTGFAVLTCKNSILPYFLLNALFSDNVIAQCNKMMVGGQYPALNQSQVSRIKIPLPPLQEQQKIAEILSTIDKKLEIERNEKAKLEKIKQGLMDLLLTGKIRVKI